MEFSGCKSNAFLEMGEEIKWTAVVPHLECKEISGNRYFRYF